MLWCALARRVWIKCNSDCSSVLAAAKNAAQGGMWRSDDGGAVWTRIGPTSSLGGWNWKVNTIAASADLSRIAGSWYWPAAANVDGSDIDYSVAISTDSGSTFAHTALSPLPAPNALAVSDDFTKLITLGNYAGIHVSTDSSATWTQTNTQSEPWQGIAGSSALGVVVAGGQGDLWRSVDGGVTWTSVTPSGYGDANSMYKVVSCSADGARWLVAVENQPLLVSSDSGLTWEIFDTPRAWKTATVSQDGYTIWAGVSGGQLWRYEYTRPPSPPLLPPSAPPTMPPPPPPPRVPPPPGFTLLAASSTSNWVAIALSDDAQTVFGGIDNAQIFKSVDGGASWAVAGNIPYKQWCAHPSGAHGPPRAAAATSVWRMAGVPLRLVCLCLCMHRWFACALVCPGSQGLD